MASKSEHMLMEVEDVTYTVKEKETKMSKLQLIAISALVLGLVLLIIGISLIATSAASKPKKCEAKGVPTDVPSGKQVDSACTFSEEANRVGLGTFLDDVKETFYKLHPHNIQFHPEIQISQPERVKQEYTGYDPTPSLIKQRTDASLQLLRKISDTKINTDLLKPRERKALAQVKHYLKHVFGQPYDVNYYAGDWMLGPNLFCWQPVCYQGYDLYNALVYHKPYELNDVEILRKKLESHKNGTLQYIANMKLGVKSGMVRSKEACQAGLDSIKRRYLNISLTGNSTGVLKEWYARHVFDPETHYFENITKEMDEIWKKDHPKSIMETVKDYFVEYFGEPIHELLRYLEEEHILNCVPSNISSGLAGLPLNYVYVNGTADTSQPTNKMLPTGEPLDGKKAYESIMPYFTTNSMSPDEVHELGHKQLKILYPGVQEIAKEVMGINNTDDAVVAFRKRLNSSESYYNDGPIPQNESNKDAHVKCSNPDDAKKYCPTRWKALMLWFKESRRVMSLLSPKTVDMFHFTGDKHTTPNCPIDLSPDLNPSSGAQSYDQSDAVCSKSAFFNIPFFLEDMGPTFSEWSVNAHEARPGHHTQVQGAMEHFRDMCGGSTSWLDKETYYTAFTEGWALYAENPLIAENTDTYDNEPMQKFGMLKWQIWRAIRLIVDTGLHYKGWSRDKALSYFNDYAWDGTDLAKKEVTRYQSDPGQATAYMIGQLDIKKARTSATNILKKKFSLRDFHYQVLAQGSSPLEYLAEHVKKYVACVQKPKGAGCVFILRPAKAATVAAANGAEITEKSVQWPVIRPAKRHYV